MAKIPPPIPFPTGRTQSRTWKTGLFISDVLIIENTHPEFATGGVGRWQTTAANRVLRQAVQDAPVGDLADHYHQLRISIGFYRPGEYRKSFRLTKFGNGHVRRRTIANVAPHAIFVETGRNPSEGYELFSTRHRPGQILTTDSGTRGFRGRSVLKDALEKVFGPGGRVPVGPSSTASVRTAEQTYWAARNLQGFQGPDVAPDRWIVS